MWWSFFDFDDFMDAPSQVLAASERASSEFLGLGGEFWAAIVGAIVGGGISFLAQLYSLRVSRKYRERQHLLNQRALAHALLFKLMKLSSNLFSMHSIIDEVKKKVAATEGVEPWQIFQPIANFPEKLFFATDEMALLLELKSAALLNEVFILDAVHNSKIEAIEALSARRQALTELFPSSEFTGAQGKTALSPEQFGVLRPKMIEVNSLFHFLTEKSVEDYVQASKALKDTAELFKKELRLKYSFQEINPLAAGK